MQSQQNLNLLFPKMTMLTLSALTSAGLSGLGTCPPPLCQISFIFMQFSAKILQLMVLISKLEDLREILDPPLIKNLLSTISLRNENALWNSYCSL